MSTDINTSTDAKAFLQRIKALPESPGLSLDHVLAPSIEYEAELRRLYAQDRDNHLIVDPYVGLIDVFGATASIRTTRARVVDDEESFSAKYLFPLSDDRRRKDGDPCTVERLEDFQKNWSIFTEGSLSQLIDWNNVIAAGGSVLACLLPLSEMSKESKRNIRKLYHSEGYPTSDIDLFIWGLTAQQAEVKINQIYEAVRDSIPWDVTCVRTRHAISIHSQYPYRTVQIVLRLYQSPAEILAGFDVDTACVAYDGSRILANHRAIIAMMRQANTVDISRRSPSYEIRLAKYASRGFEIYIPDLRRTDVDPTIFEWSINRITGLARLFVLEKLERPKERQSYLETPRNIRSRTNNTNIYRARRRNKRRYKNDLKGNDEIGGLEFNDYDLATLHIPYGPGWTAKRIEKLVYQTDLGINSTFNPRNKGRRLHHHPAFFGSITECSEDLCGYCPEPRNNEEKSLQAEEDRTYVRGRISFIEDDPGRQSMTGSFNPIDVGEWNEQAYLGPTERLFSAIAAHDRDTVNRLVASGEVHINRRDHVGRTALHVAVLCKASSICNDLIEAGGRMSARLVDGRTALHVAAQLDMPEVIAKLLERSLENAKNAKEDGESNESGGKESDSERASSEDDWSSESEKREETKIGMEEGAIIPEDNVEEPDVLDINAADWNFGFAPLVYAAISGSKRAVQMLLSNGADPKIATKANDQSTPILHPLSIATLALNEGQIVDIIDHLLRAGRVLLRLTHSKMHVVEKILQADPKANAAINVPACDRQRLFYYPLVTAISKGYYAIAALLIGYGAKIHILPDELQKAKNMVSSTNSYSYYDSGDKLPHPLDYLKDAMSPVEVAISCNTYFLQLLVNMHAQVSIPIIRMHYEGQYNDASRLSILDWVSLQVEKLTEEIALCDQREQKQQDTGSNLSHNPATFHDFRQVWKARLQVITTESATPREETSEVLSAKQTLAYYEEMKSMLQKAGAKTYLEIYPEYEKREQKILIDSKHEVNVVSGRTQYKLLNKFTWRAETVLPHLLDQYDELFEACWTGDNEKIEELCLPRKRPDSDKAAIQIAVHTLPFNESRRGNVDADDGVCTPFSVAIQARRWDTAHLVFAIATAQWAPPENPARPELTIHDIDLDDDTDSDGSDNESQLTDEKEEAVTSSGQIESFVDLSQRWSAVRSTVSASELLDKKITGQLSRDGKRKLSGSVLSIAALDGDLETFVNVCDIMKLRPTAEPIEHHILYPILKGDSPEILDEFIRRSGVGFYIGHEDMEEVEEESVCKQSKFYLGLTVHGKKRKDLAKHCDAYAQNSSMDDLPLLWHAARNGAKRIIEYLAGDGPLAAYRYYATTSSDERALNLRRRPLEKALPVFLGIEPNPRNETVVTAILAGFLEAKGKGKEEKLDMLKYTLSQFPSRAKMYLHSSLRYLQWNPLLLAVLTDSNTQLLDYLLASGVAADATDRCGYNIYHIICHQGSVDILDFLLKRLPEELTSRLMMQTSRNSGNTPLMLAIKSRKAGIVEKLLGSELPSVKETLFVRDNEGSLPVHVSVRHSLAKITSLIIANVGPDALRFENAVGETPVETVMVQWMLHVTRAAFNNGLDGIRVMRTYAPPKISDLIDRDKLRLEVDLLNDLRTSLENEGKLATNLEYRRALDSFISYLGRKCDEESKVPQSTNNTDVETADPTKTLEVVTAFVPPAGRELVHLIDVQNSVCYSLERARNPDVSHYQNYRISRRRFKKETELPEEADEGVEAHERAWGGILRYANLRHYDSLERI